VFRRWTNPIFLGDRMSGAEQFSRRILMRPDGRGPRDLRPTTIETNVLRHAEGSARISIGDTMVICAATVDERVPRSSRDRVEAG
jgi:ribonuclease PH